MASPIIIPTAARDAVGAGVTYHIEGELVPVLTVELGAEPIYFEHHILLWKDTGVNISLKSLAGAFKRIFAGMPIFMTQCHGPGRIAFSRDGAGHVFPVHLDQTQAIDVREHQFLAATDSVEYAFTRIKGLGNMLLGGAGFWMDTFRAKREGILWLHGYGNVFEINLAPGEQIDIEPGAWIYKEQSVRMETQFQGLKSSIFASGGRLFWNRFTGPGRIGMQSMSTPTLSGTDGGATKAAGVGGIIALIIRLLTG